MKNAKQFKTLKIEIVKIANDEIIATSGERRKLTDSLFGKGKDGVNVG